MFRELWSDVRYRVRALLRRGEADRELDAEIEFHLPEPGWRALPPRSIQFVDVTPKTEDQRAHLFPAETAPGQALYVLQAVGWAWFVWLLRETQELARLPPQAVFVRTTKSTSQLST